MNGKGMRLLVALAALAVMTAGCGRVGGPPGYIDTLSSGDPNRVLGRYPGMADNDGLVPVKVVGKGIPPQTAINKGQSIIMAERAAVADAYRKLAERIKGIYVQAYTKMADDAVDYDRINLETATWLRGARLIKVEQLDHGITAAHMEVKIHVAPDHLATNRFDRQRTSSIGGNPPFRWWPF